MKTFFGVVGAIAGLCVIGFAVLFVMTLKEGRDLEANCTLLTANSTYTMRQGDRTVTVTRAPERRQYRCPDGKIHWY